MQVWIGFKQNEEYVHEWTGEVAGEAEVGKAIGNAIAEYRTKAARPFGEWPSWWTKRDRSDAVGVEPVPTSGGLRHEASVLSLR